MTRIASRGKNGVLGYCLMPNHVHLPAIPHAEDALVKAVARIRFRSTTSIIPPE